MAEFGLSYDSQLSRVRLTGTAPGLADTFTRTVVERSTNGVRWTAVRGGLDLAWIAGELLRLDDYEFVDGTPNLYRVRVIELISGSTLWVEQDQITPNLDRVWIKTLTRPYLNRAVTVKDYSDVDRPARGGVFEVVGRSVPVAVSDLRGSRRWTMEILVDTQAEADEFGLVFASGDPMYVHVPADCDVPGGYVSLGTVTTSRTARRSSRRVIALPFTEVAAPGPDVVGATVTWQSVLNAYPTWQDVLDAHLTWASLLELIGDPTDEIVP